MLKNFKIVSKTLIRLPLHQGTPIFLILVVISFSSSIDQQAKHSDSRNPESKLDKILFRGLRSYSKEIASKDQG